MRKKTFYRYASKDGIPLKETTTFIQGHPSTSDDDPRLVELAGETGKWFWFSTQGYLGSETPTPQTILTAPLKNGLVSISQQDYEDTIAAAKASSKAHIESRKAQYVTEIEAKQTEKETILKRIGITEEELELFK